MQLTLNTDTSMVSIVVLAMLLAIATPTERPHAQGLDAPEVIDTIVGSEVKEEEVSTTTAVPVTPARTLGSRF